MKEEANLSGRCSGIGWKQQKKKGGEKSRKEGEKKGKKNGSRWIISKRKKRAKEVWGKLSIEGKAESV